MSINVEETVAWMCIPIRPSKNALARSRGNKSTNFSLHWQPLSRFRLILPTADVVVRP